MYSIVPTTTSSGREADFVQHLGDAEVEHFEPIVADYEQVSASSRDGNFI